ncbi:hypothetical protein ACWGH2_41860 [Streptomyces sp. NPDC054871]
MSATPVKPSDEPIYVSITQLPDGRIDSVTLADLQPYADTTFMQNARTTVWTSPIPEYEGDPVDAAKVLDLAMAADYRDEVGARWAEGEREATTFYAHRSTERTTLRQMEATLIRAGHLNVHTGMVGCRGYGLTLTDADSREQYFASLRSDGAWYMAMKDWHSCDGWYVFPGTIAPANASTRAVAAAILSHVYDGTKTRGELRPLTRLRVAYATWRRIPHWKNFKFNAPKRLARFRNRITVRIPR